MARDLLTHPYCLPEDLGRPLPDSPHAASVALPCWDHVVGYEEGRPEILNAMAMGYPRFVIHPKVNALFVSLEERFGQSGERCLAFPSLDAAVRCGEFLAARGWATRRLTPEAGPGVHTVFFQEEGFPDAKSYWQHFGKIISSRYADALCAGETSVAGGGAAKGVIRSKISGLTGASAEYVWLFPTGMAAVSRALRLAQERSPGAKSIQLGFPYVDVLKIQSVSGPGVHFIGDYDLTKAEALLANETISAIICEFPGNPLLGGCSLVALSQLARTYSVPLIVDDTPATYFNVQLFPYADMIVTSLTKAFSGAGDVMAGALVMNETSPLAASLRQGMNGSNDGLFWDGDAVVLAENSVDFERRVTQSNATTEALCDWLQTHPKVAEVFYPKFTMKAAYDEVKRAGGGYGSLFSLILHDGEKNAPRFYDALPVTKGPSLGTNFTLACPYTLLAHYLELDWAESHGVSRYLIRVSVGLEALDDLKGRFAQAFDSLDD